MRKIVKLTILLSMLLCFALAGVAVFENKVDFIAYFFQSLAALLDCLMPCVIAGVGLYIIVKSIFD